jgi:putative flippase GtrA
VKKQITNAYRQHRKTFVRAGIVTSLAATVVDFTTLYCLVQFAHLYYVYATACGAAAGAVTNFTLNRYWAFQSTDDAFHKQGLRYLAVSTGSLLLNTLLVFFFTEFIHLMYLVSKVCAALCVGWFWNYPLHRYFVFKDHPKKT